MAMHHILILILKVLCCLGGVVAGGGALPCCLTMFDRAIDRAIIDRAIQAFYIHPLMSYYGSISNMLHHPKKQQNQQECRDSALRLETLKKHSVPVSLHIASLPSATSSIRMAATAAFKANVDAVSRDYIVEPRLGTPPAQHMGRALCKRAIACIKLALHPSLTTSHANP